MMAPEAAHDDDASTNIWAVSPALRRLLEQQENLRHIEALLVNRKVYTVKDLREMDSNDQAALLVEVEAHFKYLRWNTSRVGASLKAFIQEAKNLQKIGQEARAAPVDSVDHMFSKLLLRTISADTGTLFPVITTQMLRAANEAASAGRLDATTTLHQGSHMTEAHLALMRDLDRARDLLGAERLQDVLRLLQLGEVKAAESAAFISKALAVADEVPLPEDDTSLPEDERPRKILKNAKLALRNTLLWRCIGWAQGLDSQEALEKRFPAFRDAAQTRAQLINGFSKLRDWAAKLLTGQDRAIPLPGSKPKRPKGAQRGSAQDGAAEDEDHDAEAEIRILIAEPMAEMQSMESPMKVPLQELSYVGAGNDPSPLDPRLQDVPGSSSGYKALPPPPGLTREKPKHSFFDNGSGGIWFAPGGPIGAPTTSSSSSSRASSCVFMGPVPPGPLPVGPVASRP